VALCVLGERGWLNRTILCEEYEESSDMLLRDVELVECAELLQVLMLPGVLLHPEQVVSLRAMLITHNHLHEQDEELTRVTQFPTDVRLREVQGSNVLPLPGFVEQQQLSLLPTRG
jgi:hypothetical protein